MTFGEALAKSIQTKGLSIADVSRAVGCTASNVSAIVADRNKMIKSPGIVPKIEAAVGVPRGELLRHLPAGHPAHVYYAAEVAASPAKKLPRRAEPPAPGVIEIRVWGTVAAGPFDHPTVYDPSTPVYVAGRHPAGCFALKVSGRSCTRFGICDGDTVVVRPATDGADGRFVVVKCPSGYTLKAYSRGKLLQFRPEDLEPTVVEMTEDTTIVGVVVGGEYGERSYKPAKRGRKG